MIWRGRPTSDDDGFPIDQPVRRDEVADACAKDPAFVAAPDLTESIMHRLGYRRMNPVASRLRRLRQTASRGVVAAALMAAVYAGAVLHSQSDRARKPAPTTLPAALRGDLEQVGEVSRAVRTLLSPAMKLEMDSSPSPLQQTPRRPMQRAGQSRVPWSGLL